MRLLIIFLLVFPAFAQAGIDLNLSRNDVKVYAVYGQEFGLDEKAPWPDVINLHENTGNLVGIDWDIEKRKGNWSGRLSGYGESRKKVFGLPTDSYDIIDYQGPKINLVRGYISYQPTNFGIRLGVVDTRIDDCEGEYIIHPSPYCRHNSVELIDSGLGLQFFGHQKRGNFLIDFQAGLIDPVAIGKEDKKILLGIFQDHGNKNLHSAKYTMAFNVADLEHNLNLRAGAVVADIDGGGNFDTAINYTLFKVAINKYFDNGWEVGVNYYDSDLDFVFVDQFDNNPVVIAEKTLVLEIAKSTKKHRFGFAVMKYRNKLNFDLFDLHAKINQTLYIATYSTQLSRKMSLITQWTHGDQTLDNRGGFLGPNILAKPASDVLQVKLIYQI